MDPAEYLRSRRTHRANRESDKVAQFKLGDRVEQPSSPDHGCPPDPAERGTAVTEAVYRKQLKPVLDDGAMAMDDLFPLAADGHSARSSRAGRCCLESPMSRPGRRRSRSGCRPSTTFPTRSGHLAALHAIDPHHRVIYIDSFSKVLFPGLLMGYIVAPPALVEGLVAAHLSTDMHSPLIDQAVLADLMTSGAFARHLRRMRIRYRDRQQLLVAEAARLGERLRVNAADGGLHLVGHLAESDDVAVAARAARAGVHVRPLSTHCLQAERPPALLLGYAGTGQRSIRQGISVLERVLGS